MIGVFVQRAGTGGKERKGAATTWEPARYTGNGQYLLYTDMPGAINLHHSVEIERHKNSTLQRDPNSFELRIRGDFGVEIGEMSISDIPRDYHTHELPSGILARGYRRTMLYHVPEGVEAEISIVDRTMRGHPEVVRAKLMTLSAEQEQQARRIENGLDAAILANSRSQDL